MKSSLKKMLAGLVFIIGAAGAAHTNDARALPAGTLRASFSPRFSFAAGAFGDWHYSPYADNDEEGFLKAVNLGLGLEYGILNWLGLSLGWAPGWNCWSTVDGTVGASSSLNVNGVYDLFVSVPLQLAGPQAPLKSSRVRFLLAPVFRIPLPGANFDREAGNAADGSAATLANPDKHAFGFGPRLSFDLIFGKHFFINLNGEYLHYFQEVKASDTSLANHAAAAKDGDFRIDYGYDLSLELEPVVTLPLSEGVALSIGLPLNFTTGPDLKHDKHPISGTGSSLLSLEPTFSLFLSGLFVPIDFSLSYAVPLTGKNTRALNTLALTFKLYF